jgi:predicted DNA-binding transcriptional regulator YafY
MSAEFAVERIRWLHKRIKDGYFPNAKRLAERFGISQRQAQRDVDHLRTELGAPLEFCRLRKGYRYTDDFELGASIEQGDSDDYVDLFAAAEAGENDEAVQMSIPYTAVLEVSDKLAALGLGRFVKSRAAGSNRYNCEFHNVGFFLGALLAAEAKITVVEPTWLRERLCDALERLAEANLPPKNDENQ